jgi:hypothetical protein
VPVEIISQKKGLQPRRLRFVRNTAYQGTDYGPDYGQDECEVDAPAAFRFIGQGRAIDLDAPQEFPAAAPGQVQTRDPQPEHRDPVVAPSEPSPASVPPASAGGKKKPRAKKGSKAGK